MDTESVAVVINLKTERAQIQPLFGKSYELSHIENDEIVPIGGNTFRDELTTGVQADLEFFQPLMDSMAETASGYNLDGLRQYLETANIQIEPELFAKLYSFTKGIDQKYPINSESNSQRDEIYAKAYAGQVRMSQIFESGNAACAEIAALAQAFLQQQQINSSFFSGEVLWQKADEFAEPHSFIIIRDNDTHYIFDPANPTNTTQGHFPSLYTTLLDFDQEVRKNQKIFITAANIINKKQAYFGVGNGTSITENQIV